MLIVQSFVNTPVNSNCYVLFDKEQGNDCIIIDPGTKDVKDLVSFFYTEGLLPKIIILTHEHFDHCWGVNQLVERYHIPIICSRLCGEAIKYEKRNCSVFYDNKESFTINSETISIESIGATFSFADTEINFSLTPGHTDASICFWVERNLFTGDTLIKDEKTVTKLPSGSVSKLKKSIELFTTMQGRGYRVFPGHGESFKLDGYDLNRMFL